jgi:flagellar basal-body rod protein FlgC
MAGFSIFDISGRAMSAQLVRLNTSASNLANAGSISSAAETAYQVRKPVFQTMLDATGMATVQVAGVETVKSGAIQRYEPGHPMADGNGYIYEANVDPTAEMVEMMETARQYQNNVEVMQTAKNLVTATLRLGQ